MKATNLERALGERLLARHKGQFSGLYVVGTCLVVGQPAQPEEVDKAVCELRNLRLMADHPETVTLTEEQLANELADYLQEFTGSLVAS